MYNPLIHNRQSLRKKGFDYAQNGLYFITICTKNKICIFGEIKEKNIIHSEGGNVANLCWKEIPIHFPNVELHEFIIMPNHVHGIIEISSNPTMGAKNFSPPLMDQYIPAEFKSPSKTIGSIVRGFKIGVTKWFRKNTDVYDVWQRNYHDIIIKDENAYLNISNYIKNNPSKWKNDEFGIEM